MFSVGSDFVQDEVQMYLKICCEAICSVRFVVLLTYIVNSLRVAEFISNLFYTV